MSLSEHRADIDHRVDILPAARVPSYRTDVLGMVVLCVDVVDAEIEVESLDQASEATVVALDIERVEAEYQSGKSTRLANFDALLSPLPRRFYTTKTRSRRASPRIHV